jgi:ribosomal protein S18 acetylase RimI-like enzyme
MLCDTITLRPTTPADRPFCLRLYSQVKSEELQAGQWDEQLRGTLIAMQFAAHEQHYRNSPAQISDSLVILGATEDASAQIIGRQIVVHNEVLHLADVSLLTEFRNRGFGARLLGALQEQAAGAGLALRLHCNPRNPALHLYLRQGFKVLSTDATQALLEWQAA